MQFSRISAVMQRHLLLTFRTFDKFSNIIYWPLINIVIWGITGIWLQNESSDLSIAFALLTGLSLWQIVVRVNVETAKGIWEELLSQNVVNLFSTPLTFIEWITAIFLLGLLNMILVTVSTSLFIYLFYSINIFALGWIIMPLAFSLLISGWSIGLILCTFFILWGRSAQDLVYMIVWAFAPFSAVYYPLDVMPLWVQKIAYLFPMAYVFESMRTTLMTGIPAITPLLISLALNFFYFALLLWLFWRMFEKSRSLGLARLQ